MQNGRALGHSGRFTQLEPVIRRSYVGDYVDRFGSYAGQNLVLNVEQPAPSGGMVRSQIIKANDEPVKVDHMMRLSGDNWLISEGPTRRSEFATILKTECVDGFPSALNRRAEALAMSAARTF